MIEKFSLATVIEAI